MIDLETLKSRVAAVPDGEMVAVYAETVRGLIEIAEAAALRQRAAMDRLLRMDGEMYDVPERPTLSEEDRARVEEVRERHDYIQDVYGDTGLCPRSQRDRAFLLSLIDKLTNQEPTHDR